MRAVGPLVRRNLRRGRGQFAATALLVVIAAMLLNLAVILALGYSRSYTQLTEELRTPGALFIVPAEDAATTLDDYLRADARVSETEVTRTRLTVSTLEFNGSEISSMMRFDQIGLATRLDQARVVETHGAEVENPIYAPLILKYGGYELGSPLALGVSERPFHIAGFVESPTRASMTMGVLGFQLPEAGLAAIEGAAQEAWSVSAVIPDAAHWDAVSTDGSALVRQWGTDNGISTPMLYDISGHLLRAGSSMGATMFAVLLAAFGFIVGIVVVVAVSFMIRQTVTRDMPAVGSLKAVGFTSRQIVSGIVGQYAVATVVATAVGVGLAWLALPLVRVSIEGQTGLGWNPGFDALAAAVTLGVLLGTVAIAAVVAGGRIRRTPPVDALRGGVATHAFRTNPLPLASTRGQVDWLVGVKSILRSRGRAAATIGLIALAAFASTFTVAIQTHILGDPQRFVLTIWGMDSDISISLREGADPGAALATVQAVEGIEMATTYENRNLLAGSQDLMVHVTPDFGLLRYSAIYEGRYPERADEVAMGANALERLGLTIGDTVTLAGGTASENYLITGATQSSAALGMEASLVTSGYQRVAPNYVPGFLTANVAPGVETDDVIPPVRDALGDSAVSVSNESTTMASIMEVWLTMSRGLSVAILVLTAAVIVLVLGLVVASHQTARQSEVGIMRALGFSRARISRQTAAAHLPVVAVGLAVGLVAGGFLTGPLISWELGLLGVRNLGGAASPLSLVAIGLGMFAISWLLLVWMGRNVGRLTSRELIAE
ncbi:MAG: ABC transporter permease [bacterium]|nr:ABC transporter permease [bacterium]